MCEMLENMVDQEVNQMSLTQEDLKIDSIFVNGGELVATAISVAITCKDWPTLPREVSTIASEVTSLYHLQFPKISPSFYLKEFTSYADLLAWLSQYLMEIPAIRRLNVTLREWENGEGDIDVDDESRSGIYFSSRYSPPKGPLDDFVDLDAYVRNVCHELIRKAIEINFSSFK
jgi:hypothetical protein